MKILGPREQRDHHLITRLDQALGGAILASGAVYAAGWHVAVPANILLAIWGWTDQKSTAMELVRAAADSLSGKKERRPHGPERLDVITAAHTTIVVAAFYEALEEYVPRELRGDVRLTDAQTAALQRDNGLRRGAELVISTLYERELPAPSAARGFEGNVALVRAWMTSFSKLLSDFRHQQGMRDLFPEDGPGADRFPGRWSLTGPSSATARTSSSWPGRWMSSGSGRSSVSTPPPGTRCPRCTASFPVSSMLMTWWRTCGPSWPTPTACT